MTAIPIIDFIVTRKQNDPTQYRRVIRDPRINLIEVDYIPNGLVVARQNMIKYGNAPYVSWFDPDDQLYEGTMAIMLRQLELYPDLDAVLMLSDTKLPDSGKVRQINIGQFTENPVNCHLMRCIRRTWLTDHVHLFDSPIPEWPLLATLLTANIMIIPKSGYMWIPSAAGAHRQVAHSDILSSRTTVRGILGRKYDYKSKYRQNFRRPQWQLPPPKHLARITS